MGLDSPNHALKVKEFRSTLHQTAPYFSEFISSEKNHSLTIQCFGTGQDDLSASVLTPKFFLKTETVRFLTATHLFHVNNHLM